MDVCCDTEESTVLCERRQRLSIQHVSTVLQRGRLGCSAITAITAVKTSFSL